MGSRDTSGHQLRLFDDTRSGLAPPTSQAVQQSTIQLQRMQVRVPGRVSMQEMNLFAPFAFGRSLTAEADPGQHSPRHVHKPHRDCHAKLLLAGEREALEVHLRSRGQRQAGSGRWAAGVEAPAQFACSARNAQWGRSLGSGWRPDSPPGCARRSPRGACGTSGACLTCALCQAGIHVHGQRRCAVRRAGVAILKGGTVRGDLQATDIP